MSDEIEEKPVSKPIWHSPAWITAIVGVISAFLTVPEVVSGYLSKQQDIALAKQKTEEQRVKNENDKQSLEFTIVNNTLAQQGSERIFVLRYLAKTLDDTDAREWANDEVARLDRIAQLEREVKQKTIELASARQSVDYEDTTPSAPSAAAAVDQVAVIRRELEAQSAELEEQKALSGISAGGYGMAAQRPLRSVIERDIERVIVAPVESDSIEEIRQFQTGQLGFSDVGAHFMIRSNGVVETGRDISKIPAILAKSNQGTIGIYVNCRSGNMRECDFSKDQLLSLDKLMAELSVEHGIDRKNMQERGEISPRHAPTNIMNEIRKMHIAGEVSSQESRTPGSLVPTGE